MQDALLVMGTRLNDKAARRKRRELLVSGFWFQVLMQSSESSW